jgi:hypothetical protein
VKERDDHRNIKQDFYDNPDRQTDPNGEKNELYIYESVERDLPKPAKVIRVTVGEDDSLSATYSRE